MRKVKLFSKILIFILVLVNVTISVFAIDTGFITESLSEDEITNFLNNINISPFSTEPAKHSIVCFDVNDNGLIAVGRGNEIIGCSVCVYSADGEFQYGFSFNCYGSFGVEMNDNSVVLCLVRSSLVIEVDSKGEVLNVLEIQNVSDNYDYWNDILYTDKIVIGDTTYILKNDNGILNAFAFSFSQLISKTANGEVNIIYQAEPVQITDTGPFIVIFIAIFVCAILGVVWQFVKLKLNKKRT